MEKKILVWFCGTGTPAKDMDVFFEKHKFDKKIIIEGLGTANQIESAKVINNDWVSPLQTYRQANGYSEKDTMASVNSYFKVLDYIQEERNKNKSIRFKLVIGGHSRGAAVGMVSLLNQISGAIKINNNQLEKQNYDNKSYFSEIVLIPVDPVPGGNNNFLDDSDGIHDISQILRDISEYYVSKEGGNLKIKIISFTARFDTRNKFKLDTNWSNFYKNHPPNLTEYIAGFRHSSMIYKEDQNVIPYENDMGPIDLLKYIIYEQLEDENYKDGEITKNTYDSIKSLEILALKSIIDGKPYQGLVEHTERGSYRASLVYIGSLSLKEALQKIKDNKHKKENHIPNFEDCKDIWENGDKIYCYNRVLIEKKGDVF